ncbi:MAG TPA: CHAT domain-containing tetratricopeptide repeat protein [Pyrinomonadaceae bacterium]|nr:CHAT domain-containing tetratricopeptide repeat protein [Pyrinomonadaceae bacterium]
MSSPQDAGAPPALAPVERELKGGEAHSYGINLAAGQFLRALVEQKGVDVEVLVSGPDGRQLSAADSPNGLWGPEPLTLLAEVAGDYLVVVRAPNKQAQAGRYEISPLTLREATPADRQHADAERLFQEGSKLRSGQTAGERRAAVEKFEQAIPLYRAAGDAYRMALSRLSIGIAYARVDEPRKALEHFGETLSQARALEDRRLESAAETFLGGMSDLLGEPGKALEHYNRALALSRESGNSPAEASSLNNIGTVYFNLADWQKALDYWSQSLALLRPLGYQQHESVTLRSIGLAYNMLGEPQEGLRHLEESLKLSRAIGDRNGESTALSNIGNAYYRMGDLTQALDFYNRALEIQRALGNRGREADTLDRIGSAYAASGQPTKALEYHQQALPLQHAAGNPRNEAMSLRNLGHAYNLLGQPEKALENFNRALPMFQAVGDLNGVGLTLEGIARAERALGNLQAAREHAEQAIASIERVRARVTSGQMRSAYLASRHDAYRFHIDLLMDMHRLKPAEGFDALALEASERARARNLLELLTEAGVDIRQGVDPQLTARERELSRQVAAKAQRVTQRNTPEQLAALKKEIAQLEADYEQVRGAIRRNSPRYAALVQPEPLKLAEVQRQLLDPDTLLLEYALGDERSYVWAVTKERLTSRELPKRAEVEAAARRVYELLTARSRPSHKGETAERRRALAARADAELPRAAAELSRIVLAPIASELGTKRLVIVADGALQYVPFAMLPEPTPEGGSAPGRRAARPLVVGHEVVSLPSASTLAVQRRELQGRRPAQNLLAVLADPVFTDGDGRVAAAARPRAPLTAPKSFEEVAALRQLVHLAGDGQPEGRPNVPRLPYTRREAEQILAASPSRANLAAVDFKASRATATSPELGRYRYVHFATHGYIDSERPGLSALVLSLVDKDGRPQDGFLRANEIYNLSLPAELVVLSACQTGLGKEVRGEGLVGLTRGFMYAGTPRVVVSLWNVNDRATSELMARFYTRMLKGGERPAAALRRAQVEMLEGGRWGSPYYWAAFTLQGEWR